MVHLKKIKNKRVRISINNIVNIIYFRMTVIVKVVLNLKSII